jgi:hypothetical protein
VVLLDSYRELFVPGIGLRITFAAMFSDVIALAVRLFRESLYLGAALVLLSLGVILIRRGR